MSLKVGVAGEKDADGWHILHVYGSPNAEDLSSDGTILKASARSSCAQRRPAALRSAGSAAAGRVL